MQVRRTRTMVLGAVVLSVAVLAAWFPASALMSDRRALATVTNQLDTLRHQDRMLAQERHRLGQPAEVERVARQQFQMVTPGQQAYQVLPATNTGSSGASYADDPGAHKPVAPSGTAQLPPGTLTDGVGGPGATAATPGGGSPRATSGSGFLERMLHTLEFWR